MATANHNVDSYIESYDLEPIPVCEPHRQSDFDEWLMNHSIGQLFDVHSSTALRWQIIHWIYTIPFVSQTYADPKLRSVLGTAVDRFRDSLDGDPSQFDPSVVFSVPVKSLGFEEVAFCVSEEFEIIPHPYSYEAVCIRLHVDPEVFRQHIEWQMKVDGISELIKTNDLAVRPKNSSVTTNQIDLFGPVDYSDLSLVIKPITVSGLRQPKPDLKVAGQWDNDPGPVLIDFISADPVSINTGS